MDGTTESIITVIGHPIAGNPSQLAIERALGHLDLDWRVLSFDVEANSIIPALNGCEVLGFRGVLVDRSVQLAASRWYQSKQSRLVEDSFSRPASEHVADTSVSASGNLPLIDCLYRGADGSIAGRNLLFEWSSDLANARSFSNVLWIGNRVDEPSIYGGLEARSELTLSRTSWPPDPDEVLPADLIVLGSRSQDSGESVDVSDWPDAKSQAVVLDVTAGDDLVSTLQQKQYHVIPRFEVQVALLRRSIQCWTEVVDTDETKSQMMNSRQLKTAKSRPLAMEFDTRDLLSETIADAIEEYLGV